MNLINQVIIDRAKNNVTFIHNIFLYFRYIYKLCLKNLLWQAFFLLYAKCPQIMTGNGHVDINKKCSRIWIMRYFGYLSKGRISVEHLT